MSWLRAGCVRAQVFKQQPPQRLILGPRGPHGPVHQAPRQAPDIGEFRVIRRL